MTRVQLSAWLPWQIFVLHHRTRRPATTLESWLREPGSLTARLRSYMSPIDVRLTGLYSAPLGSELARRLSLHSNSLALVREVVLSSADTPCFRAQTFIPKSSMVGEVRRLRNWHNRSLGDFLFREPLPKFSNLEFALFKDQEEIVWGRRRCHYLYNKPIMVCEYFSRSSRCSALL